MIKKTVTLNKLSGITAALMSVGIFFVPLSYATAAEKPILIKKTAAWSSYSYIEKGKKVCFMVSSPVSSKGNYTSRDETFLIITQRPADKTRDVVSFIAGYTYKTGSSVTVTADGKKFTLFTQGDTAWAADGAADKRLTQAILKGNKVVVTGTSSRGTFTTDTFSLKGAGTAYKDINSACKM